MRFNAQQRWFPRDPETPLAYEDASAISGRYGRAVVADGVSSSMMSRSWARLLARTAAISPPAFDNESLSTWVAELQSLWWKQIDRSRLGWSGLEKLRRYGAQSTLLIVDIAPMKDCSLAGDEAETTLEYRINAHSIGDCCLFLVRDGRNVLTFPMVEAVEFEAPPRALSSKATGIRYEDQFRHLEDRCRPGDMLILCTDAIGAWAMREYEAGRSVNWQRYRDDESAWQADIMAYRNIGPAEVGNQLVIDDCTLLVLDIIPENNEEAVLELEADHSDETFVLLGVSEYAEAAEETSDGHQAASSECDSGTDKEFQCAAAQELASDPMTLAEQSETISAAPATESHLAPDHHDTRPPPAQTIAIVDPNHPKDVPPA